MHTCVYKHMKKGRSLRLGGGSVVKALVRHRVGDAIKAEDLTAGSNSEPANRGS